MLRILCDNYTDIYLKHTTDIGKMHLVQTAIKPYSLPLQHHVWLGKELRDPDKAHIIFPSISNFTIPLIIVPERKDHSTHGGCWF